MMDGTEALDARRENALMMAFMMAVLSMSTLPDGAGAEQREAAFRQAMHMFTTMLDGMGFTIVAKETNGQKEQS